MTFFRFRKGALILSSSSSSSAPRSSLLGWLGALLLLGPGSSLRALRDRFAELLDAALALGLISGKTCSSLTVTSSLGSSLISSFGSSLTLMRSLCRALVCLVLLLDVADVLVSDEGA